MRNYVTFTAKYPDDMVVDEQDNVTTPPGRNMMGWLLDALARDGFQCTSLEQHSHYGWAFEVVEQRETIWCMFQQTNQSLIITDPVRRFFDWVRGRRYERLHQNVIAGIDRAFRSNPQITNIQWMTVDEHDQSARGRL